ILPVESIPSPASPPMAQFRSSGILATDYQPVKQKPSATGLSGENVAESYMNDGDYFDDRKHLSA
ncbi:MAG: hypothetical protein ABEI77_06215, partial [Halorientalis sp.]